MATQTLTIEGITFPKYSSGSSKRNFRLVFYIVYKDGRKTKTAIVTKPATEQWQWRKSSKDNFFPEGNDLGDSVELNILPMRAGEKNFGEDDYKIIEISGKLQSVGVQFIDVHDASLMDFLKDNVLPEFLAVLKTSGFNPIDLIPVPGVITGVIKSKVKIEDLIDKADDFLKEQEKDKVLFSVTKKYADEELFEISGRKEWEKNKTGTYGVTIGFE
ncbi:MAG TPA: hypothetical protein PKE69_11815 [Pyrinomonadaceae bacterium]|nr:hypothetical protein [Pyrinomonadaceae bacterium]